jgi:hypothetical protein
LSREKLEKAGEMADKIPEISKEKQKFRFRISKFAVSSRPSSAPLPPEMNAPTS